MLHLLDIHKVNVVWVKGHAGHEYNERCDKLAVAASKKAELLDFVKEMIDKIDTTVLRENKPGRNADHPTMKPLPLIRKLMLNSSRVHQAVFDPFLGSGSTLIASEQLERICLGSELDPKYCDVIVKRYIKFKSRDTRGIKLMRNGKGIDLDIILNNWCNELAADE